LRLARRVVAVVLGGAGLFAACSSDQRSRVADPTGPGSTGAAGSGMTGGLGAGGSISITTGVGGGAGSGSPPLPTCSASMPCPMNQLCVKGPKGGLCSPTSGPCDLTMDTCQNDTYCCGADCRIDGKDEPVCVTGGTRPVNTACNTTAVAVGVFTPNLQCQWPQSSGELPLPGDAYPNHKQVLVTPLVADMPTRPAGATWSNIIIVTSDATSGAEPGNGTGGRIRILNGQTCVQEAVITAGNPVRDAATPAIADLDGDGTMEIVTRENFPNNNKIIAFKWSGNAFGVMWEATGAPSLDGGAWDGVSIHDLNDDGVPEVIARYGEVYDGKTGRQLSAGGGPVILESDPVLGDVDGDGKVELIANKVFQWNGTGWIEKYPGLGATTRAEAVEFYGFADFGKRNADGSFDPTQKDGVAEIVAVGAHLGGAGINEATGFVGIYTLQGEARLRLELAAGAPAGTSCPAGQASGQRGGAPTIGNFVGTDPTLNPNGMPQLATAGAYAYRVYDLQCANPGSGCQDAASSLRWSKPSQDCTSGATGSTIFDFEGDGKAEAIYSDECFVRVYEGRTGEVLFSQAHVSATWWEQNIVADPDHSDRSKIIFGNASTASVYSTCNAGRPDRTPAITTNNAFNGMMDTIHKGLRCATNEDCPSMNCQDGFCRCMVHPTGPPDIECGNDFDPPPSDGRSAESGLVCTTPLAGTPGTGNVCRMQHGNVTDKQTADKSFTGIRVYRDKLDRWASSRAMWNQHAYSITNIEDDGKIPKTSAWTQNFKDPKLNNYRQNRQGGTSKDLADITGSLDAADACALTKAGGVLFTGRICNHGLRGVGAQMPATFYLGGGDAGPIGAPICGPKLTVGPLPAGSCSPITCEAPAAQVPPGSTITMIVNDAGGGQPGSNRIVDECKYENNTAVITIAMCAPPPK
jgi:hypothetical protein